MSGASPPGTRGGARRVLGAVLLLLTLGALVLASGALTASLALAGD